MIQFDIFPFKFAIERSKFQPEYNLKVSQIINGIPTTPYSILSYHCKFYISIYNCNAKLISTLSTSDILNMRIDEDIRIFTLSKKGTRLLNESNSS